MRSLGRLMPFFFLLVIFWGINAQMTTTFFNMGCQMDLEAPWGGFTVPVACLSLFNAVVIILLVPVFENWIYPALKRCGVPLTALHKMLTAFNPEAIMTEEIFGYLWGKLGYGALLTAEALTSVHHSLALGLACCLTQPGVCGRPVDFGLGLAPSIPPAARRHVLGAGPAGGCGGVRSSRFQRLRP